MIFTFECFKRKVTHCTGHIIVVCVTHKFSSVLLCKFLTIDIQKLPKLSAHCNDFRLADEPILMHIKDARFFEVAQIVQLTEFIKERFLESEK